MAKSRAAAPTLPPEEVEQVDEPQHLAGDNEIEALGDDDETETVDGAALYDDDDVVEEVRTDMSTTKTFMGGTPPMIVDAVLEVPTVVVDAPPKKRVVVVSEDIGPVFYGQDRIELKRGQKYRVPEHIFVWLKERNLIWFMG